MPDEEGDYMKKKMSEYSGEELLTEVCHHCRLRDPAYISPVIYRHVPRRFAVYFSDICISRSGP